MSKCDFAAPGLPSLVPPVVIPAGLPEFPTPPALPVVPGFEQGLPGVPVPLPPGLVLPVAILAPPSLPEAPPLPVVPGLGALLGVALALPPVAVPPVSIPGPPDLSIPVSVFCPLDAQPQ